MIVACNNNNDTNINVNAEELAIYDVNNYNNCPGVPIIFCSSYQGSLRKMTRRHNDDIEIVSKTGKPDSLITISCSPC